MQQKLFMVALGVASLVWTSCSDPPAGFSCLQGVAVSVNSDNFCVADNAGQGVACPADAPVQYVEGDYVICAARAGVDQTLLDQVVAIAAAGDQTPDGDATVADGTPGDNVVPDAVTPADAIGPVDDVGPTDSLSPGDAVGPPDTTPPSSPRLHVDPPVIDLGVAAVGVDTETNVTLTNVGGQPLMLTSFSLAGHPGFRIGFGEFSWPVSPETSEGVTFPSAPILEPGDSLQAKVVYRATGPEEAQGTLVLFSDDPTAPGGTVVPLIANATGPCIAVSPSRLDFGGRTPGVEATGIVTVRSCGQHPLQIHDVTMVPTSSMAFTRVTFEAVLPIVLEPGETIALTVHYVPAAVSPLDAAGQPVRDTGTLRIQSNAFVADTDVSLSGYGTDQACPTAVIVVQEGTTVVPDTRLHLIGSNSHAPNGPIADYAWEVVQPSDATGLFVPSHTSPDPTFHVSLAGTYIFRLNVTDTFGAVSCTAAEATVHVQSDAAFHVELVWRTPGDPDETNEGPDAGADLDLHFLHPMADGGHDADGDGVPDGYFDLMWDLFWFNPSPMWWSNVPDPTMDRDDVDGLGPENLSGRLPEPGDYQISVNYWDDAGYGFSDATVRVYIFGNLTFEATQRLNKRDMWKIGHLSWPSGNIVMAGRCANTTTPCSSDAQCPGTCEGTVLTDYRHPLYPN